AVRRPFRRHRIAERLRPVMSGPTPKALGYAMPAEWAAHRATWLSWPHNLETWPTQLEKVRAVWVQMICALAPHEQVCLLVNDAAMKSEVRARLTEARADLTHVACVEIPT